ncbi:DUF5672 family protein [Pedobacter sp. WC2501]|uniref:DUF5672 family protein n=1 Tax=Pedobacter sp. WC2501 TaxID=3461400 RepID=UPI0040453D0F
MKRACVVIPIYKEVLNAFELISLQQCFNVLGEYDIYFVIPARLEATIANNVFIKEKQAQYKTFNNHFFFSTTGYNLLMKKPGFYKAFLDYEFMLIYQLDAFVFKNELAYWCNCGYDYIGAPFMKKNSDGTFAIAGQGNGGFSLRKISSSYKVVKRFKKLSFEHPFFSDKKPFYINLWRDIKYNFMCNFSFYPFQPVVNEDVFWAVLIPEAFKNFRVPPASAAIPFSFEVNPRGLYQMNGNRVPFGCHAWWRYDLDFWKNHISAYGYEL